MKEICFLNSVMIRMTNFDNDTVKRISHQRIGVLYFYGVVIRTLLSSLSLHRTKIKDMPRV